VKKGRQRLNVAFPLFIPISGIDGNENGYKQEGCKGFALRLVEVSYHSGLSETSEIQNIGQSSQNQRPIIENLLTNDEPMIGK